jgi:hypothetical protein
VVGWLDEIFAGTVTSVEQIAAHEKCSIRQVNMTISLAFLALHRRLFPWDAQDKPIILQGLGIRAARSGAVIAGGRTQARSVSTLVRW